MTEREPPASRRLADSVDPAALWDLVPDGLLAVEPSGRIAAANVAATVIFGAEADELVGRPVEALLDSRHRAAHVRDRVRWSKSPHARMMGSNRTFPARTLDGRTIHVQVALNPIHIDDQPLTVAVVRDVTNDQVALREQAVARDEIMQRLFGLGMSLRSVIPSVEVSETAGRIAEVVEEMSAVVEALENHPGVASLPPLDE